jgi:rhamnogalacturonyl hydrolase YesR
MDEDKTFWAISDPARLPNSVPAVWAVEAGANRLKRYFDRLETDCVAEFGWMGGCVLEAYDALAGVSDTPRWNNARDRWLGFFLDDQHLVYQDRFGRQCVDSYSIIEATLPIASVVRCRPQHPIVDITADYLRNSASKDATCEGCYTVAYTLLQIAASRGRSDLVNLAFNELSHRREKLFFEGCIYLRHHGTHRTYRNWTRGVGWYLLGNVKCLGLIGVDSEPRWRELADHIAERVAWAMRFQRADGLWDNFFDEPGRPPDTAGSAGIAAALVHAHELGLAGTEAVTAARRCWDGLANHLFVDGWLGGTAPSNKRGEEAQHGITRASETFGMGLMGTLAGALKITSPR